LQSYTKCDPASTFDAENALPSNSFITPQFCISSSAALLMILSAAPSLPKRLLQDSIECGTRMILRPSAAGNVCRDGRMRLGTAASVGLVYPYFIPLRYGSPFAFNFAAAAVASTLIARCSFGDARLQKNRDRLGARASDAHRWRKSESAIA
jgi:hypothetical protein